MNAPEARTGDSGRFAVIEDKDVDRFVARLRARLAAGAATYGDRSFTRPAAELLDEVQQELEDVCGWSLLVWTRLDRLRKSVASLGDGGEQDD